MERAVIEGRRRGMHIEHAQSAWLSQASESLMYDSTGQGAQVTLQGIQYSC